MTMHVNVSGVWKEIPDPQVNVSGVWKEINEGWVNVSGVWKQFYARPAFEITPTSLFAVAFDPSSANVNINFQRDGDISALGGTPGAGAWIEPRSATIGDSYQIRATLNSGTSPASGTLNTWQALSSTRAWSWTRSGIGFTLANVTFQIRRVSDSVVVVSQAVSVLCEVNGGG